MEMGGDMDTTMMQTVAAQVARRWRRKGVVSYPVEDMEQDAMAAMLEAHGRFNPEHGVPLRAYLWRVAVNATNLTVAKALCPLSASRASTLREVQLARVDDDRTTDIETDHERRDVCTRARARVVALATTDEDQFGVRVLLGDVPATVADAAGVPVRLVYMATLRMKRRVACDATLYQLAKENT